MAWLIFAASALLGGALGFFITRRRLWGAALGALAFGVAGLIGAAVLAAGAPLSHARVERVLQADPEFAQLMTAWRRSDPAGYRDFLQRVAASAENGESREVLVERGRGLITEAARPRLARLDDQQIAEFARVTRDEFLQLGRARPDVCHAMIHRRGAGEIRRYLSSDVIARERAIVLSAFSADGPPGPVLEEAQARAAVREVFATLEAHYGADVLLLGPAAPPSGSEERVCALGAAFYDAALQRPDAAALLRFILTSP